MMENRTVVEMLRHARHDWMNQLQLIKGNLELNNVERAKEIIDDIIFLARQEAKLSNLKLPNLATLLITFNWEPHHFQLEYEIADINNSLENKLNDQCLTEWVRSFLHTLDHVVDPAYENHLTLSVETEEEQAKLIFDFFGKIIKGEDLAQFFQDIKNKEAKIRMQTEQILVFELLIALNE